jgi:prepilin-type N-terminal cleavage/methylation domain-containing protein
MICNTQPAGNRRRAGRRGFTLTELLVVIGIIVLVISIAAPMITRAYKVGDRTKVASDLQAIAAALEAYKQDHGSYPQVEKAPGPIPQDFNGARMLCRALIGPGPERHLQPPFIADGADGPGFRTRMPGQGQVYGPYIKTDQFKLANPSPGAASTQPPGYLAMLDKYNRPILYYPATGKPNIRKTRAYAWDRSGPDKPMYNALDNWSGTTGAMPKEMLARMLGDFNANGMIDDSASPPEQPAYEGAYLLWSAGPDETFGIRPGTPMGSAELVRKAVEKCDDITNFR